MIRWTENEELILKENYNESWEFLQSLLPDRSVKSLKTKIYNLGLRRDVSIPYSEEEDKIIHSNFGKNIDSYIHLLNNRSELSVKSRAKLLGLTNINMKDSDLIYDLYVNKELSMTQIANKLNKSKHSISAVLRKLNVPKRILQEEIDSTLKRYEIVDLYNYGFSITAIGELYQCSRDVIQRILNMENVKLRFKYRPNKLKINKTIKQPLKIKRMPSLKSIRKSKKYKDWRKSVLERDKYTCQCCGEIVDDLDVHHIKSFLFHPELRTEVSNGISLCKKCHSITVKGSFHNYYGTYDNNLTQLQQYFDDTREWLGLPLIDIVKDITYKEYIFEN